MQFAFLNTICAVLIVVLYSSSASAATVCTITATSCAAGATACGRYGRSNLCMKFTNDCTLQVFNCGKSTTYRSVADSYCSGIPVNTRRRCNGLSSTSSGSGSSSNSNVTPIVIGK